MLTKQLISIFLFLIPVCITQDIEIPYGFRNYDKWKKLVPKNQLIPTEVIKNKIQLSLKEQCDIGINKIVLESFKRFWESSFYIVYLTDLGYLSVFALSTPNSPKEKFVILKTNFFTSIDDSLFKYVQITPQDSQDSKEDQSNSLQQQLNLKSQQYRIDVNSFFTEYYQKLQPPYNLPNEINTQCKNRMKIKNTENLQKSQILTFDQYAELLKKINIKQNTQFNSLRKVAQLSLASIDQKIKLQAKKIELQIAPSA